jgi:hypothetical protein
MNQALWITEAEVAALVDMGDAIAALERSALARFAKAAAFSGLRLATRRRLSFRITAIAATAPAPACPRRSAPMRPSYSGWMSW